MHRTCALLSMDSKRASDAKRRGGRWNRPVFPPAETGRLAETQKQKYSYPQKMNMLGQRWTNCRRGLNDGQVDDHILKMSQPYGGLGLEGLI